MKTGAWVGITLTLMVAAASARAAEEALPSVATKLLGSEPRDGFLALRVDRARGKLWLVVPPPDSAGVSLELLYVDGLASGLGSNPVGLDRGQLGDTRVLRLRRVGGKVLFEQVNTDYVADSVDAAERRAVAESFATSVVWAAPLAGLDADGTAVVDFTSFVVRDAHGVAATLDRSGQGGFHLDESRSAVDLEACHVFPDNVELEAILTFAGTNAGEEVRGVTPDPGAVTLVQHHSLSRLPAPGYRPRPFDPRAGTLAVRVRDYAAPLSGDIDRQLAVRHRLSREKPIIYYVDRGAPEPIREALLTGAGWWRAAFAKAGFPGGFEVALLPEGVHPLDIRYNVIQWVHRATRGWSYGGGVVDPRTGERVKGQVTLGSLRVRHDRLLFEGLLGADRTGSGAADDPAILALRRIRQLAAHEVGHTLGLAHNFAGSSFGRGSVMDYPAPWIQVDGNGRLDASAAYAEGVGVWDELAIELLYGDLGATEPMPVIAARVEAAAESGLVYLGDDDARGPGAANPRASLWDNGADPVAELLLQLSVRAIALRDFGERNLRPGAPRGQLREVLAPLYFHHRYQLEAAAKLVGGVFYRHGVRGGGPTPVTVVPAERQRAALAAMLAALEPDALDLSDEVLAELNPPAPGRGGSREQVVGDTDPLFDPLAAARTAATLVVDAALAPARAARLVEQHRRDAGSPGLDEVIDAMLTKVSGGGYTTGRSAELAGVVRGAVIDGVIRLAASGEAPLQVRALVEERLRRLRDELATAPSPLDRYLSRAVGRFLDRTADRVAEVPARPAPPGSPIGADDSGCDWGRDREAGPVSRR